MLWLSMLDFLEMLLVTLPVDDRIHPQSNNLLAGLENKATRISKLNNSLEEEVKFFFYYMTLNFYM